MERARSAWRNNKDAMIGTGAEEAAAAAKLAPRGNRQAGEILQQGFSRDGALKDGCLWGNWGGREGLLTR